MKPSHFFSTKAHLQTLDRYYRSKPPKKHQTQNPLLLDHKYPPINKPFFLQKHSTVTTVGKMQGGPMVYPLKLSRGKG